MKYEVEKNDCRLLGAELFSLAVAIRAAGFAHDALCQSRAPAAAHQLARND